MFGLLVWLWDGTIWAAIRAPAPRPVATTARRDGVALISGIDVLLCERLGWLLDAALSAKTNEEVKRKRRAAIFFVGFLF
jgi:hypothetical protein